ncbi:YbaB/EbfC family nucleoid-associated protein [Streptomyces sp. NBC_01341]|uniref:YbaB/EbfC family nucleoid-associated protein n=1 Tax=Streptomyces sp. NBC_01341 TaxID=2903831 RepID=UPI002E137BF1|nr:YbaB/EbfC family nucleoid-associated protein [Streptomyces sp. NBC_01341]WSI30937.1 YbaB/EbfC family nucleoid-associated protein [Streptomyces sp. NBC_01341]
MQQRIAQAMAELENVQNGVAKAEAELRAASVTVRSRDRAVEVTVGSQGELTGLVFLEGKQRTMAAGELAASVLEAAGRARTQMSRRVMKKLQPFTESGGAVPGFPGIEVDWERIFGPGVRDGSGGGRRRDSKLQDEIGEDAED